MRAYKPIAILVIDGILLTGCPSGPGPGPVPPENEAPETYLERTINEDNTATYLFWGEDPDGSVEKIYFKFKNKHGETIWFEYEGDSLTMTEPIYSGENRSEAYAEDDEGEPDPTPAEDAFEIPSESEARNKIRDILNSHSASYDWYEEDYTYYVGGKEMHADFFVRKTGGTDAVINYISDEDDFSKAQNDAELLDDYFIDNLNIPQQTADEIDSRTRDFVNDI